VDAKSVIKGNNSMNQEVTKGAIMSGWTGKINNPVYSNPNNLPNMSQYAAINISIYA
jgi:hypothetical protein